MVHGAQPSTEVGRAGIQSSLLPAAWVALLLAGAVLAFLAADNERLPGDLAIMRWVQSLPLPGMPASRFVRVLGATEAVLATGAVVVVLLWVFHRRREALLLACCLALLPLLQHGLKELVDRPRPSPELVHLRAGFSSPSFPAGHVMSPTLLYGFLAYLSLRNGVMWPLAAPLLGVSSAVLVLAGPANVYVGVHWPSDVAGGYVWGLLLLLPLVGLDGLGAGSRMPQ